MMLPDRVLPRPVCGCRGLIDNHHARRGLGIRRPEITPAQQRNPHRLKISGGHHGGQSRAACSLLAWQQHRPGGCDAKRSVARQRRGNHSRDRSRLLYRSLVIFPPAYFVIRLVGHVVHHDAQVRGVEARVDLPGTTQAAREESGADQRHQREGHLRHHQHGAGMPGAVESRRRAGSFLEIGGQIGPGRSQGRHQAEQHSGGNRDARGEHQHLRIQLQTEARMVEKGRTQRPQQVARPASQKQAGGAAPNCQQKTLRQHLADQPAATRAHRQPDRDLPMPPGGPRQQQVGHIGARDQQHQGGNRHQHGAGLRYHGTCAGIEGGFGHRRQADRPSLVVARILTFQLLRQTLHGRFGLAYANTGLEPAHLEEKQGAALGHHPRTRINPGVRRQRQENIGCGELVQSLESRRRHSNNAVRVTADLDCPARHIPPAAE